MHEEHEGIKRSDFLSGASFAKAEVRPLRVGRRFWIGPARVVAPAEAELLPIWLIGGPAFGTGTHPTTQLCLQALQRHLKPGARVLDLGTGSGILAIAAARLGARMAHGLDIDPRAVEVARANVVLNDVADKVRIERGTLADVRAMVNEVAAPFTWVMANVLAHVLVEFFDQGLPEAVEPRGWLVLSGFLRSQTPQLRACLVAAELQFLAQEEQDEWVCLIARRPDERLSNSRNSG